MKRAMVPGSAELFLRDKILRRVNKTWTCSDVRAWFERRDVGVPPAGGRFYPERTGQAQGPDMPVTCAGLARSPGGSGMERSTLAAVEAGGTGWDCDSALSSGGRRVPRRVFPLIRMPGVELVGPILLRYAVSLSNRRCICRAFEHLSVNPGLIAFAEPRSGDRLHRSCRPRWSRPCPEGWQIHGREVLGGPWPSGSVAVLFCLSQRRRLQGTATSPGVGLFAVPVDAPG